MIRSERCVGCKSCELACAVAHSASRSLLQAVRDKERPAKRVFVETSDAQNFPVQCRQCSDHPCVMACMAGAMQVDPQTGLVQVDTSRCVGCWMCVMTCPFGAIAKTSLHKAAKCDQCQDNNFEPACVKACPTKALEYVEVNTFAQAGRKQFLVQHFHMNS